MTKWRNSNDCYGATSQILHWLVACLMIVMLIHGLMGHKLPGPWRHFAFALHKSVGVTILGLAVVRLFWRFFSLQPGHVIMAQWQALAAKGMHWALYGLMLAMPLSGWLMSSAFGRPVVLFGLFTLPELLAKNGHLGGIFQEAHEVIGNLLIATIGLHIVAALYHHFIQKDDVLKRMLPIRFFRKAGSVN